MNRSIQDSQRTLADAHHAEERPTVNLIDDRSGRVVLRGIDANDFFVTAARGHLKDAKQALQHLADAALQAGDCKADKIAALVGDVSLVIHDMDKLTGCK